MSRTYISFTGGENIVANLLKLEGDIYENTALALEKALNPVAAKMKSNAQTMFNKGYSKGTMVKSIGVNVDFKKMMKFNQVAASVGVFDLGSTGAGDYGMVSGRRVTAPMIASFYEAGIQPHSTARGSRPAQKATDTSRGRAAVIGEVQLERNNKRKDQGLSEGKLHGGSAPIPFISSAAMSMMPDVMQQVEKEIFKMLSKAL